MMKIGGSAVQQTTGYIRCINRTYALLFTGILYTVMPTLPLRMTATMRSAEAIGLAKDTDNCRDSKTVNK